MKNKNISIWIGLIITILALVSCNKDKENMTLEKLPENIQKYIANNFPESSVSFIKSNNTHKIISYEVEFKDGLKLDFDTKNRLTSIENQNGNLENVISAEIIKYIKKEYPENFIVQWELDVFRQQITLNDGVDLKFGIEGNFLGIE